MTRREATRTRALKSFDTSGRMGCDAYWANFAFGLLQLLVGPDPETKCHGPYALEAMA